MTSLRKEFNNAALVVIDVQQYFAQKGYLSWGNRETEEVSVRIAEILPELREAGLPIYVVGVDFPSYKDSAAFYKIATVPEDRIIYKSENSAFKGSNIDAVLKQQGIRNLFLCGFNYNVCVFQTAMDARALQYKVTLLTDLSGNGGDPLEGDRSLTSAHMKDAKIALETSDRVFRPFLRQKSRPCNP